MTDSGFLAVEGGRLECARWGTTGSLEGPPLVLLHEGLGCVSMWRDWDAITCPVLLLRGAHSELLLASTADEMTRRGPPTRRVEIPDCGHAPALLDDEQLRIVADWLGPAA